MLTTPLNDLEQESQMWRPDSAIMHLLWVLLSTAMAEQECKENDVRNSSKPQVLNFTKHGIEFSCNVSNY